MQRPEKRKARCNLGGSAGLSEKTPLQKELSMKKVAIGQSKINQLSFNGTEIKDRDDMLCLTDMWKAAGSPKKRSSSDWRALPQTSDFIATIKQNTGKSGISNPLIETRRGRGGGTWAHWQIGMAYAKYLSPEFHAWCNEVVKAYMEGAVPPSPKDTKWLVAREDSIAVRNDYTGTLKSHGCRSPRDYADATNALYVQLMGAPAKTLKKKRGIAKGGSLRNKMSRMELAQVTLSEELAIEHITEDRCHGADECIDASAMAARSVYRAVESSRAARRIK